MLFRILIGVGLAAAGYLVGREMGRREAAAPQPQDEGPLPPEPVAATDEPDEEGADPREQP